METIKVTVIGTGALGSVLAKAFYVHGIAVYSLFNRSSVSLQKLAVEMNPKITGEFPAKVEELGNLIFITTPDQQILTTAENLSTLGDDFSQKTVVHCSGTKSSRCLSPLQKKGANIAAFHPVQTFTENSSPKDFKGIYFDLEGDEKYKNLLKEIAETIGSHWIDISIDSKKYLHAAAVMASNYLLAVLDTAAEIAVTGGLKKSEAQKLLLPLAKKTIENASVSTAIYDSLSGPVARGDDATVAAHIELLQQNPQISRLYKELGMKTIKLADKKGSISPEQREKLTNLFQN